MVKTKPFIILSNVSANYGEVEALKNLSLEIPSQRITVLIGPSGCGKSTTLRCLNGLVKPSAGTISYEDQAIKGLSETALRRKMGYVIQSVGLMPHLSVEENIDLVPKLLGYPRSSRRERVERLLNLVRLDPAVYLKKYPHELSGGEAQRIGVARALGGDPPLLLMDEPFGAVDPLVREQLQGEFIRIHRKLKKTVIFVTHDIDEALRLADYLVVMNAGEVVQAAEPEKILAEPKNEFVDKFLGPNRALKRLTLFTADRWMEEALIGKETFTKEYPGCYWETDQEGHPLRASGWVEGRFIEREIDTDAHTVQKYSSLRECISKILTLGLPATAVVDERGVLCGEVRFATIQKVSRS
ncbi:MAG: ABC transporter ATP-binding protein [Sphaerochaetaceae bacterium]